jgi:hypothetical protein
LQGFAGVGDRSKPPLSPLVVAKVAQTLASRHFFGSRNILSNTYVHRDFISKFSVDTDLDYLEECHDRKNIELGG